MKTKRLHIFGNVLSEPCFIVFLIRKIPFYLIKALCKCLKQVIKMTITGIVEEEAKPGNFTPVTFGLFGGCFKLFLQVLLFQGQHFHLLLNLSNFLECKWKHVLFLKGLQCLEQQTKSC